MTDIGSLKVTASGDRDIRMTRVFDAPRRLVFDAFTRPELLKRWLLGPQGWEMVVCQVTTEVGGRYRYEWRNTDGAQFGVGGVCREFVPPERIAATEAMDGYPTEYSVTMDLVELHGKTTLTTTLLYDSREDRDAALKSGMERGVAASYDRLDEVLASRVAQAKSQGSV